MIETTDKTIVQVYDELVAILKEDGIYGEVEYFDYMYQQENKPFPTSYRWVACYAVEGGNEGHYVHVELINLGENSLEGERNLLYVGKTLMGIDHALKLSNILTKAFYR